jgi:Recombinase zinc beta ribbon domain/Recombinase
VVTPTIIRFMAQRPSQSSAFARCQLGSATSLPPRSRTRGRSTGTLPPWKPIGPAVRPQRWARRPPPRPWRGPHSAAASASSISPSASSPAARQNRSKLAVISSSARPTGDRGTPAAGVLSLVMALPASRGFDTPSLLAQGGQRRFPLLNIERDIPHIVVSDPVYAGLAYVNRHEYVVPERHRPTTRRTGERTSRRARPREQWIAVPVPPLVDQDTWDRTQAQMARNAKLSFRRNKKTDYLLRCLLKCGNCGLGIHGCVFPGSAKRRPWRYYRCSGKDPLTRARETRCPRACIDADALDRVVWDHVAGLLGDPGRPLAQFERFAAEAGAVEDAPRSGRGQVQQRIERIGRADRRLVEAYQAAVISLPELAERRGALAAQRRLAEEQLAQLRRLQEQRLRAHATLESLAAFSSRVAARLQTASITERQAILKLVVERIIVHDDHIEIEHVIPLPEPGPDAGSRTRLPVAGLRSDGAPPADRPPARPGRVRACTRAPPR